MAKKKLLAGVVGFHRLGHHINSMRAFLVLAVRQGRLATGLHV